MFYRVIERGIDADTKQPFFVLAYWNTPKDAADPDIDPHLCDHRFGFISWTGMDDETGRTWEPQDILDRVAREHWAAWSKRAVEGTADWDESQDVPISDQVADPVLVAHMEAVADDKEFREGIVQNVNGFVSDLIKRFFGGKP